MYENNIILESKNESTACVSQGQQENVQLITVINFIEKTMKTLSNYAHLKTQLDFNLTQWDR